MDNVRWASCDECGEWSVCIDMPAGEYAATTPRLCQACLRVIANELLSISADVPYVAPPTTCGDSRGDTGYPRPSRVRDLFSMNTTPIVLEGQPATLVTYTREAP